MLPTFETSVLPAIDFANEAESIGLDGVFGYDHLWPMGHPGLPSISVFPLLSVSGVGRPSHTSLPVCSVATSPAVP